MLKVSEKCQNLKLSVYPTNKYTMVFARCPADLDEVKQVYTDYSNDNHLFMAMLKV